MAFVLQKFCLPPREVIETSCQGPIKGGRGRRDGPAVMWEIKHDKDLGYFDASIFERYGAKIEVFTICSMAHNTAGDIRKVILVVFGIFCAWG